eukprot:3038744-Prymnesium_polylepis.2
MLSDVSLVLTFVGSLDTQAQHLLTDFNTTAVQMVVVTVLLFCAGTVVFAVTLVVFLLHARRAAQGKPKQAFARRRRHEAHCQ